MSESSNFNSINITNTTLLTLIPSVSLKYFNVWQVNNASLTGENVDIKLGTEAASDSL